MPEGKLKYIDAKGKTKKDLIREQTPIQSKSANDKYRKGWNRIFKKKETEPRLGKSMDDIFNQSPINKLYWGEGE